MKKNEKNAKKRKQKNPSSSHKITQNARFVLLCGRRRDKRARSVSICRVVNKLSNFLLCIRPHRRANDREQVRPRLAVLHKCRSTSRCCFLPKTVRFVCVCVFSTSLGSFRARWLRPCRAPRSLVPLSSLTRMFGDDGRLFRFLMFSLRPFAVIFTLATFCAVFFFGSFIRFDQPLTNSPPLRSRKWVICRRFSVTGIPRVFFAFSGVPGRTGAGGPGDSFGYVVFVTAYVSVCVCPCHSGCSVGVVSVLEVWGVDALWWAF